MRARQGKAQCLGFRISGVNAEGQKKAKTGTTRSVPEAHVKPSYHPPAMKGPLGRSLGQGSSGLNHSSSPWPAS